LSFLSLVARRGIAATRTPGLDARKTGSRVGVIPRFGRVSATLTSEIARSAVQFAASAIA
jgi:hypothetical protein